jgi:hypothetical protein
VAVVPLLYLPFYEPEKFVSGDDMFMQSKLLLWQNVGYRIHWNAGPGDLARPAPPNDEHPVVRFHQSKARHLVVRAPIRTSKSWSAAIELLHDGLPMIDLETKASALDDQVVWAIGVNYGAIKEWEYLYGYLSRNKFELIRQLGGRVVSDYNNAPGGNLRVVVEWPWMNRSGRQARSVWEGKSSENEKSLQGEEVRTACLSEAAEHSQYTVDQYLEGRCGRILYPTSPDKKAFWIYQMIQKGDAEEIVYTRECNPAYDWTRYVSAKAKAISTWGSVEKAFDFREQMEGEWMFYEGAVLPFRWQPVADLPSHIVNEADPRWVGIADWLPHADYAVSMDYGFTDAAAALLWAIGTDGQKVILADYKQKYRNPNAFVSEMRAAFEGAFGITVKRWIPDPQKPELTDILRECGLPLFQPAKSADIRDRAASSMALVEALSTNEETGRIPLLIHERCGDTIREWKLLRRKESVTDQWAKSALLGEDHLFDAARYGAHALRHWKVERKPAAWMADYQKRLRMQQDAAHWRRNWAGVREVRV